MSSAEDEEVTQVAPPQLLPSARPAPVVPERTENSAAPRLIPQTDLPDDHDFRELTGPTEVAARSALPRTAGADAETSPGEHTGELPAPPRPGRNSAFVPELLDARARARDLSGPTSVVITSRRPADAGRDLTEPNDIARVSTDIAPESTDVGNAPTQLAAGPRPPTDAAEPSEEWTSPIVDLAAVQAERAVSVPVLAPPPAAVLAPLVPTIAPVVPASRQSALRDLTDLPDVPDMPDMPELPDLRKVRDVRSVSDVPEPPSPPSPLERPPSGPVPSASDAVRESAKVTRLWSARGSLADSGMRQEEITRGHAFIKLLVVIIGVSGSLMFAIDADPVAEAVTAMGLVYTLGAFAWFLYRVRDVSSYNVGPLIFLIVSTFLAAYTTVYLWGVSSPMPVIFALSIAFIAHSVNPTIALSGYLACAVAQLGLTLLLATGVLRDRSLIPLASLGVAEILVSQFVVHSMYFSAFLVARYNRRMAQQALVQLERAAVEVARRDLLLQEARQELSNALRVGAAGRYTGQVMGRFRLGMLLGHGAVGEVYEAGDLDTGGVAAIKLLHGHATADERQVQRFLREAEHASRLRSPHVVRVFDYGHAPDGSHYLAMERLRGSNLAEHLRVYERMPLLDVVTLVDHVGAGLQAAWEAGIVHRDIKPQNIFRSQEPHGPATWKILDFGVSKMAHQNNTLTQGNIIGTPSYMAPEQVEGQQLDHRADLFALAAVAYRALTGRPAFGGDKLPVVLYRVVYGMPDAPSSMVAVPADVDLVFARALAKRPEDRYATSAELARALALASRNQLTEAMRAQSRALVRVHPWGTLLRPQAHRSSRSA